MLSNLEVSSFCGQMAMVLKAGIATAEGIEIMRDDAATVKGKELLQSILDKLSETGILADALKDSGEFPDYASDMIRIGEQSGKLEDVMRSLSAYYKREDDITTGIQNAVTYPLIMVLMMFVVVGVLINRVLPIFSDVYKELGATMTGVSGALLTISSTSGPVLTIVLVILAAVMIIIAILLRTNNRFRTHFYLSRKLYRTIAESRFASGMSLTLQAGLDPDESLMLVSALTGNPETQKCIEECKSYLHEGDNFSSAIQKSGILPPMYARIADIGIRSGALDEAMTNISDMYEEEIDTKISRMLSILEPTLVIILAVIVGVLLLSVMLPLVSMMSQL